MFTRYFKTYEMALSLTEEDNLLYILLSEVNIGKHASEITKERDYSSKVTLYQDSVCVIIRMECASISKATRMSSNCAQTERLYQQAREKRPW